METKVIILGREPKKEKKKIEFSKCLTRHYTFDLAFMPPNFYKYIELICLNYTNGLDLMFAYNDQNKRDTGALYLGKFNDGVV